MHEETGRLDDLFWPDALLLLDLLTELELDHFDVVGDELEH